MIELTHTSVDGWPVGAPFPAHRPMQAITLGVIVRTVFGVEEGERSHALIEILRRVLDLTANPLLVLPFAQHDLGPWSPWGRFQRLAEKGRTILRDEIRRGRRDGTAGRTERSSRMMLDVRATSGGCRSPRTRCTTSSRRSSSRDTRRRRPARSRGRSGGC